MNGYSDMGTTCASMCAMRHVHAETTWAFNRAWCTVWKLTYPEREMAGGGPTDWHLKMNGGCNVHTPGYPWMRGVSIHHFFYWKCLYIFKLT